MVQHLFRSISQSILCTLEENPASHTGNGCSSLAQGYPAISLNFAPIALQVEHARELSRPLR